MVRNAIRYTGMLAAVAALILASGCRKKAYENPIAKDTQQPDKVLFDTAMKEVEHGRYERARLELQTLMNTYDTSEYLAKAKLLVADSWYREGGAHGFAQAEAEYKDFILFYPQMEEAAEAQSKICNMQYQQIDKADRDAQHAFRADEECRTLLTQFPNSKFAPDATQKLRNIQEVLAEREYDVGNFYHTKGSYPASANRLQALTDQYPLYSKADEALWMQADDYARMGDRFEDQQAAAYTKIVKDYPLSSHVEEAKAKLEEMKRPVPQADPVAYARMKYELDNREKRGLMSRVWGPFAEHPYMGTAAKSGAPQMGRLNPTIPASVPPAAAGGATETTVTASQAANPDVLEKNPDARSAAGGTAPANGGAATPAGDAKAPADASGSKTAAGDKPAAGGDGSAVVNAATNPTTANPQALPQNHTGKPAKTKTPKKSKKKKKDSTSQPQTQTQDQQTQQPAKPAGQGQTPPASKQ
jgi:outer membrane protein assembly factor BamD